MANSLGRSIDSIENRLRIHGKAQWKRKDRATFKEKLPQKPQTETTQIHTLKRIDNFVLSSPYIRPKFLGKPSRVLSVGDFHAPFHHKQYFDFLYQTYQKYKCDKIVFEGDLVDQHKHSRWPSEVDSFSPKEELELSKEALKILYKMFPQATVCIGNHDNRYKKIANLSGILDEMLKDLPDLFESPVGWDWVDKAEIDGIIYEHGEMYRGQDPIYDAVRTSGKSVVFGHYHSTLGVQWMKGHNQEERFAMCSGCGIDFFQYAFRYAKFSKKKPILGCGVILEGEPIPVRMVI